ncbi:hypothetical protein CASFOL_007247 [Castilleja foliolosa]|uniref:Ion transport domain-containing protein n=1 Tax=Castilleja foliolosa TaxID=1961234 RepID=A0ABD3ECI9_9LAMI
MAAPSERRSPTPLLYRRFSSLGNEMKNLASISSNLLPAFGTVVGEGSVSLKRFVIAPYDRRYRWWQTFLVVLVVYSAWSSPFELAFRIMSTSALMPIDLVVNAFFAVDIILTFFVAYLEKSTYLLIDDHKKIALSIFHIYGSRWTLPRLCHSKQSTGFSDAAQVSSWMQDPVRVPVEPITRARTKKFKESLMGLIQEVWAQELLKKPIGEADSPCLINLTMCKWAVRT